MGKGGKGIQNNNNLQQNAKWSLDHSTYKDFFQNKQISMVGYEIEWHDPAGWADIKLTKLVGQFPTSPVRISNRSEGSIAQEDAAVEEQHITICECSIKTPMSCAAVVLLPRLCELGRKVYRKFRNGCWLQYWKNDRI